MIFNNLKDLADYWECSPVEESMSQTIYGKTDCGAWLKIETHIQTKENQRWVAILNPKRKGVIVHSVKRIKTILDIEKHDGYIEPKDAPEKVQQFLSLDLQAQNGIAIMEGVNDFKHLKGSNVRLKFTQLSFAVDVDVQVEKSGITIGSIIEGSEATCTPITLYFPFSSDELEDKIIDLEHEADELFDEANGEDAEYWQDGSELTLF